MEATLSPRLGKCAWYLACLIVFLLTVTISVLRPLYIDPSPYGYLQRIAYIRELTGIHTEYFVIFASVLPFLLALLFFFDGWLVRTVVALSLNGWVLFLAIGPGGSIAHKVAAALRPEPGQQGMVNTSATASEMKPGRPTQLRLIRTFRTGSGLLRLHYPEDFIAKPDGDNITFVEPTANSSVRQGCMVSFVTIMQPATQNVRKLARIMQDAHAEGSKNLIYKLISQKQAECLHGISGIELKWTSTSDSVLLGGRECIFIHKKRGYSITYQFYLSHPVDAQILKMIVDATELVK